LRYCWHGYLLEQDANDLHGPADATVSPSSLASLKSGLAYLGCRENEAVKRVFVSLVIANNH